MFEVKTGGISVGITCFRVEADKWMKDKTSPFDRELYKFTGNGKKLIAVVPRTKQPAEWANKPRVK
jgi:hypothetical protein